MYIKKTLIALTATATLLAVMPSSINTPISLMKAEASSYEYDFFNKYGEEARQVAHEKDLYASVLLAQMALESGFGKSGLSKSPANNLFGIKGSYNGQSVSVETKEDDGTGNLYTITDNFRKYPSSKESMQDYARLLNNGYYKNVNKSKTSSYKEVTQSLQGTYATDTKYASKLDSLIERYDLTKYDSVSVSFKKTSKVQDTPKVQEEKEIEPIIKQYKRHNVILGDNLYDLSIKYNNTIEYLQELNELEDTDLIYVGDSLKVSEIKKIANHEYYIVKSGDTLNKIAKEHNTTYEYLLAINQLEDGRIFIGDAIQVPEQTEYKEHLVSSGDTLNKIADFYKVTPEFIKLANDMDSDVLTIGETIKVKIK